MMIKIFINVRKKYIHGEKKIQKITESLPTAKLLRVSRFIKRFLVILQNKNK